MPTILPQVGPLTVDLPDGEYHDCSCAPLYFRKNGDVCTFRNGCRKPLEEVAAYCVKVCGPLIESPTELAIATHYGKDSFAEALVSDEAARDMFDSMQPSWCTVCGEAGPAMEPDSRDTCRKCGNPVKSLEHIILAHGG